jgi:ribonuclease HI
MRSRVRIATDGSAIGNPGPGGWAAILSCDKKQWTISGSVSWTTAQEMELTAAIEALRSLPNGARVELLSDSEYLIQGIRHLAGRWCSQGWRNSRGLLLQDRELWQEVLRLDRVHQVSWRWVKGHSGHPMQAQADALAYSRARRQWVEQRRAA